MGKFWATIVAVSLLWAAAPALAEDAGGFTRVVIPVINQNQEMVVLTLDGTVTTPGRRYLDTGHAVTLEASDPARDGLRLEYEHVLDVSQVSQGIEPWCRVKIKTVNTAGRPGSALIYCAAAATSDRCVLQIYNEAQVCWVLVQVR